MCQKKCFPADLCNVMLNNRILTTLYMVVIGSLSLSTAVLTSCVFMELLLCFQEAL